MPDAGCRGQGKCATRDPASCLLHPASFLTFGISFAVVTACSISAIAANIDVKLRERVVPQASVVRLGDVAEVTSADREQARRLAAVPLMPAPAPETQRFLQQREIADMLAASGVDLAEIRLGGPSQVAVAAKRIVQPAAFSEPVTTSGHAVSDKRSAILAGNRMTVDVPQLDESQTAALTSLVQRIIGDYVKSKSGKTAIGRIECSVQQRQLAQLAMATSAPVASGGNAPWTGRQNFVFSFVTLQGPAKVPVAADIADPPFPAIVAIRPVARGNVITAADVELQIVEPSAKTSGSRAVADSVEKIIGREARQAIQAGEVVFVDQVKAPLMVKKGDVVTVASQGGGIRVRTSARALQDGAQGELIQVEALGSKDRYDARVVGLRQAAIFTPTRAEPPQRAEQIQTARVGRGK
jgi:flagella basal body P-ring formation protein FlgA